MSSQLDILALEPFFGGARRNMLETIIRCSKHRWTLLKLPPRRLERRLSAASIWFAEQLSRHWVGRVDVLFTSEAMNLADLYRFVPALARKPSIVYFHSNQLPDPAARTMGPHDVVNLNTATAATEVWFNSLYHLRLFLAKASALVQRHQELAVRSPMPEITAKAHVMSPPVDLSLIHQFAPESNGQRNRRRIFVETRDADPYVLNRAMATLSRRGEQFEMITIGPVDELSTDLPRKTLPELDEAGQARAMLGSGIFISTRRGATADHHAVRALASGCWPLLPAGCAYGELIPQILNSSCLYDGSADVLAGRIQDAWHLERPSGYEVEQARILHKFDPNVACRLMDERFEQLAQSQAQSR